MTPEDYLAQQERMLQQFIEAAAKAMTPPEHDPAAEREAWRKHAAMFALNGLLANPAKVGRWDQYAAQAVEIADALLDALAAKGCRRPCTCHPEDCPPVPCPHEYALSECRAAALAAKGK